MATVEVSMFRCTEDDVQSTRWQDMVHSFARSMIDGLPEGAVALEQGAPQTFVIFGDGLINRNGGTYNDGHGTSCGWVVLRGKGGAMGVKIEVSYTLPGIEDDDEAYHETTSAESEHRPENRRSS